MAAAASTGSESEFFFLSLRVNITRVCVCVYRVTIAGQSLAPTPLSRFAISSSSSLEKPVKEKRR